MPNTKTEDIKVRVPIAIKLALQSIAQSRLTTESEILREALLQYLKNHDPEIKEAANAAASETHRKLQAVANISYLKKRSRKKKLPE
jgi:hypothetical protein